MEDDIGGVASLVTGLSRHLHRHRACRAAPETNTLNPLEIRQLPDDFADALGFAPELHSF